MEVQQVVDNRIMQLMKGLYGLNEKAVIGNTIPLTVKLMQCGETIPYIIHRARSRWARRECMHAGIFS